MLLVSTLSSPFIGMMAPPLQNAGMLPLSPYIIEVKVCKQTKPNHNKRKKSDTRQAKCPAGTLSHQKIHTMAHQVESTPPDHNKTNIRFLNASQCECAVNLAREVDLSLLFMYKRCNHHLGAKIVLLWTEVRTFLITMVDIHSTHQRGTASSRHLMK